MLFSGTSSSTVQSNISELENSMISILKVFHKYSGHKSHLKKAELKDLINWEMRHFIKKVEDDAALDQLFSGLDQNGDMEMDLKGFLKLIAQVISACHDSFSVHH
ncbi:hypothetical protein AALO_G00136560 [Alosa alosa]|uniref:S100/CaBP-9k-type calcium binding subdomain domain-containing protein n=1 Tax=Alosa alosa TaxID=278164 RepID=A0AAV6GLU0_9TELE|nr:protein S100-B-like [Alosa alosa]KAG5274461.1 hypothetical protein AALO_G00136560 [Alosa alosa]